MERREKELLALGGIEKAIAPKAELAVAIDHDIDDHKKSYGRSKAQVLQRLKNHPFFSEAMW